MIADVSINKFSMKAQIRLLGKKKTVSNKTVNDKN